MMSELIFKEWPVLYPVEESWHVENEFADVQITGR